MAELTGIQSRDIPAVWDSVKGFIQDGLAEGESLDAILERLTAKTCQLYVARDGEEIIAACVTELPTIGGRKVCNIISVGGSRMDEWVHHMETLKAWAKSNGCVAMRFPEIRPGWKKIFPDFTVTKITLERPL
ncbi:MAG: hypothetical protein Q8L53_16705 [Aestuariivirga sp.]|nr:hypothetical protein [Aestuariivirga sp.]